MNKEERIEDELDIELIDDESDEDVDEVDVDEDYDDFEDVEDSEDDEELAEDDASEDSEGGADEESESANDGADTSEAENAKTDDFTAKLLKELGYEGTYEEMRTAYEAEHGAGAVPPATESAKDTSEVEYEAMAKQMLDDINKEFGLDLKDFSEFEDLETFANLAIDDKVGAIKAFRATNYKMIEKAQRKAAVTKLGKATRNVPTLPKSESNGAGAKGETISKREIRAYMDAFPDLGKKEVIKLIKRVHKNN